MLPIMYSLSRVVHIFLPSPEKLFQVKSKEIVSKLITCIVIYSILYNFMTKYFDIKTTKYCDQVEMETIKLCFNLRIFCQKQYIFPD